VSDAVGSGACRFNRENIAMAKKLVVFLITLGVGTLVFGQTSADLNARYQQITSYQLRPDSVMTPKYATDGQVCEMVIERRQKTETGIVFAAPFSEHEVSQLIDELAPEVERGRNLTKTLNSRVDGGFITTEYTYENVLVRVYGITRPAPAGDRVIIITWPKRTCGGGQNSANTDTVDPKTGKLHLTVPVPASSKPKQ
jgi:hypothetical protein